MKLYLRAIPPILLLLLAASTASADPVTLQLTSGGTDTMGGVYVGQYSFTETVNGQTVTLGMLCDDYGDDVSIGEQWAAVTSSLPTAGTTTTGLQFSSTSTLSQYEEAAWLAQQIYALGPVTQSNAATIGYLQYALWDIFTPGASSGLSADQQTQVAYWLQQAEDNYNCPTCNYSNVVIFTPTANGQPQNSWPQEYIWVDPPANAPEPGSLVLLAAGLFSLVAFRRRLLPD